MGYLVSDIYKPLCNKYYIYYKVKVLCVKTWGIYAQAHKIYELEKCYFYRGMDEGYEVNSYKFPIKNADGVGCVVVLKEESFNKYFVEIPGTYQEV